MGFRCGQFLFVVRPVGFNFGLLRYGIVVVLVPADWGLGGVRDGSGRNIGGLKDRDDIYLRASPARFHRFWEDATTRRQEPPNVRPALVCAQVTYVSDLFFVACTAVVDW